MTAFKQHKASVDRWAAFAFGVVFVSVILYLATVEKNPTALAIKAYVTVLALAAAGVGAMLPGFLSVRYKNWLRAGGGLALFAVVYGSQPVLGSGIVNIVEPAGPAEPVAQRFLDALTSGDPANAWALLPTAARDHVNQSESTWRELYKNNIAGLGELQSRTLMGQGTFQSPPGHPPGLYRTLTYRSRWSKVADDRAEQVVVRANSSAAWEVYTYYINPIPRS